jgi:hypothetical protein
MPYSVLYDIQQEPPFYPGNAWLAGGLFCLGAIWTLVRKRQQRSATTGYVLMGFASLFALIGIGLMSWDHHRLLQAIKRGEAKVVEGPVQSWGTERQRTARKDRHEYTTYERFYVGNEVWFGYRWEVEQAGFHNQTSPKVAFRNGMLVRATYLYADGEDSPPRIVRLESVQN